MLSDSDRRVAKVIMAAFRNSSAKDGGPGSGPKPGGGKSRATATHEGKRIPFGSSHRAAPEENSKIDGLSKKQMEEFINGKYGKEFKSKVSAAYKKKFGK